MKKVAAVTLSLTLLSAASTALAAPNNMTGHVSRLGTDANREVVYVWRDEGPWVDFNECANNTVVTIDTSTEAGKLLHKSLLAALLGGRAIKVHHRVGTCSGDYPLVGRVDVYE